MIRKIIIKILLFTVILIGVGCQNNNVDIQYLENSDEVKKQIELGNSSNSYKKYVGIEMKETEIRLEHLMEDGSKNENNSDLYYNVIFTNISQDDIYINLKLFIPEEINSKYILGDYTLGPKKEDVLLKPGEKINIKYGTITKKYSSLTESEKEEYNKFKDILYLELLINNTKYYLKLTP